jgi:hypothetical protein
MGRRIEYRCEAATVEGFIQQLAVSYLKNGYFFYVTGHVREGKDPRSVDRKLLDRYGIEVSKFTRARQKKAGRANLQYLRHGQFFVILATLGVHPLFSEERDTIRDARRVPIKYAGYSVGYRGGRASVRIDRGTELNLKAYFEDIATKASAESLAAQIRRLPFEPYAPVYDQLRGILRAVNEQRRVAGLTAVPFSAVRIRRRIVKPFEGGDSNRVELVS